MTLDRSVLGNLAQEMMEQLEAHYGEAENVQLGAAIITVEVTTDQGDGRLKSDVSTTANIGDPYRVVGIFEQAKHTLMAADEL